MGAFVSGMEGEVIPRYQKVEVVNAFSKARHQFITIHPHCLVTMKLEGDVAIHSPPITQLHYQGLEYKLCDVCHKPFANWRKRKP